MHALQPLSANTPLHVGDPPYHESDFVIQFDGGAYRTLGFGGAGVVLWQHTRGSLVFIDSLCLPLYPCPDAAHAEAAGAAAAVLLAAKHYPILRPNRILIKGDNRAVIDFMTHTSKYRRPDLQQALQEAHHLLAFRLPPCTWCYTPREFNKCADFLAGIARDHAREQLSSPNTPPLPMEPFFFPLPPSLAATFAPAPPLSMSPTSSNFTFNFPNYHHFPPPSFRYFSVPTTTPLVSYDTCGLFLAPKPSALPPDRLLAPSTSPINHPPRMGLAGSTHTRLAQPRFPATYAYCYLVLLTLR